MELLGVHIPTCMSGEIKRRTQKLFRWYTLARDRDYQSQSSHVHKTYCDKCDDLTKTMDDIEAAIEAYTTNEVKEEFCFVMGRLSKTFWAGKHICC